MDVNDTAVNTVTDEMSAYIDMLHTGVRMGVMSTRDCAEVVAIEDSSMWLRETEFVEKRTEPDDLTGAVCAGYVFSFAGRQRDNCLLF